MKKVLLFFLTVLFSSGFIAAQNNKSNLQFNYHDFARWSIGISGGTTIFDGDIKPDYSLVFKTPFSRPIVGLDLEYGFNPMISFGLAYNYLQTSGEVVGKSMSSEMHLVNPYIAVNMLNLFFQKRDCTKWGLWGTAGIGLGFYKSDFYHVGFNPETIKDSEDDAIIFPLGLKLEYNFTNTFALGVSGRYTGFTKDDIEGGKGVYEFSGVSNDFLFDLKLNARFKFFKKDQKHVNNVDWVDYLGLDSKNFDDSDLKRGISTAEDEIGKLRRELSDLRKSNNDLKTGVNQLRNNVSDLQDCCDKVGRDSDGDGVPDIIDSCPETPGVNPKLGCPEIKKEHTALLQKALYGIHFDTGKDVIKPTSYSILNQVVSMMKENPAYNIQIKGHTDDVGGYDYNMGLSDKRSKAVRTYLIEKGVSNDRIMADGYGYTEPTASNSTAKGKALNRRVEFIISFKNQILQSQQPTESDLQ